MKVATALLTAVLFSATASGAQQQRPQIRQLGATTAKSTESLGNITAVRQVGGGAVLVNDAPRRRVLLFDSTLARFTVVADSTSATSSAYSGRMAGLIPYRGDSALFVDPTSLSMMVIDPNGKLGRVMSVPRSEDAMMLAGSMFGIPGFDASGRLIYRGSQRMMRSPGGPGAPMSFPSPPDSAPIVRVDLATRKLDTLTFVKTPKVKFEMTQVEGRTSFSSQVNPLPVIDDWAVLSNGTLVVVRGQDYHVDIFGADGAKVSAPKMPFDWQRLSDEDKIAFIDSVKAVRERLRAAGPPEQMIAGGGATGGGGGATEMRITMSGPAEGRAAGAAGAAGARTAMTAPQLNFVPPSELPDYKPAFFAGSMRADADGNLWIRTIPTKAIPGGPVYDVVNSRGELVDRVQVPAQRTIVGFGSGGTVYLSVNENGASFLERARVR